MHVGRLLVLNIIEEKFNIKHPVKSAKSFFKIDTAGAAATGRTGVVFHPQCWQSKEPTEIKKNMVTRNLPYQEEHLGTVFVTH